MKVTITPPRGPGGRVLYGLAKSVAYDGASAGKTAREVALASGIPVSSLYYAARRIGVRFKTSPLYIPSPVNRAKTPA
jgi:hypothetical protein